MKHTVIFTVLTLAFINGLIVRQHLKGKLMNNTDNLRDFTGRDNSGRFAAGNSGRPVGARGKTSRHALEQIKAMQEGAIQKLWEAVQNRERWAIEFVLAKILPAGRTVALEGLTAQDVMVALQEGDISPDEAASMSAAIKNLCEIVAISRGRFGGLFGG